MMMRHADSEAMNQVGKLDAGNRLVRFEKWGLQTRHMLPPQASTLLKQHVQLHDRKRRYARRADFSCRVVRQINLPTCRLRGVAV